MDIDGSTVVGVGGGVFGTVLCAIEVYRRWNSAQAHAQGERLGTQYESQMYQELLGLRASNTKLQEDLRIQERLIGELKSDLEHARADLKQYKLLMENALKGYDALKAENAVMRSQLEGKANLPTTPLRRPL